MAVSVERETERVRAKSLNGKPRLGPLPLGVSTTARECELRALQWRSVDFINRKQEIPKSKTEAGVRLVPLTEEAYDALLELCRRAETFGRVEPSHFVFAAFRSRFRFESRMGARGGIPQEMRITVFDPTHPVGGWRTAWRTLTRKAGLPGLRFHDLRHTAISALGEAGVPDRVIMDIAGHVSPRMLRRYSHIKLEAKRTAIQALSSHPKNVTSEGGSEGGNVTKHVTKLSQKAEVEAIPAEVVESIGRPVGTRTPDLYRVNAAILGFTTTYKTAGTAKVRGSRIRHRFLWVGLWVGIFPKISVCSLQDVKFYCKKT